MKTTLVNPLNPNPQILNAVTGARGGCEGKGLRCGGQLGD